MRFLKPALPGLFLFNLLVSSSIVHSADDPVLVVSVKRLSMEVALDIAKAAVETCRKEGVQVAATVVDRGGHPQVVLRDVLAPDLTLKVSQQKAYTAMSFNLATSAMAGRFKGSYSVPKVEGLLVAAGGLPIQAGGNIYGGVGVSGAPSGELDEKCAKAGIAAVLDDLEMAD